MLILEYGCRNAEAANSIVRRALLALAQAPADRLQLPRFRNVFDGSPTTVTAFVKPDTAR